MCKCERSIRIINKHGSWTGQPSEKLILLFVAPSAWQLRFGVMPVKYNGSSDTLLVAEVLHPERHRSDRSEPFLAIFRPPLFRSQQHSFFLPTVWESS